MNNHLYILDDDKNVVPCSDVDTWDKWMTEKKYIPFMGDETALSPARVGTTHLGKNNEVWVSTVFLGMDHGYDRAALPVLFETMVFGGNLDQEQVRYCTWEEAVKGHADMVMRVRAAAHR